MLYTYNKRLRRVSNILDEIHDKGYPEHEYSVVIENNSAGVMIGTVNELISDIISKYGTPDGWTANDMGKYYKFSCEGKSDTELSDLLDGFYYWFGSSFPEYNEYEKE